VVLPPEYLNAFKGHIVMEHGCGQIAQLLASIEQNFSHAGIMTENRVQIMHSTDSEDRVSATFSVGIPPSLDENVLRFGFPGSGYPQATAPRSVDEIVHSYCLPEPETGRSGGSNPLCPGQWAFADELNPDPQSCSADAPAIPSIVVRSAPGSTSFPLVASAGDAATMIQSHYRFDDFSHADQALVGPDPANPPSSSKWAVGSIGTVSSSFPWRSAFNAADMNGTLRRLWPAGPQDVPDGMRHYIPEERLAAGVTLYGSVYNQLAGTCDTVADAIAIGGAVNLDPLVLTLGLSGRPLCDYVLSSVANQTVNCFASDGCADHGSWRNSGPGVAVSEDDISHWDATSVYGYNEPLVYLPASFRHKYHQWVAAPDSAALTVHVVLPDNVTAVQDATVIVDTDVQGTTDIMGNVTVGPLALGLHTVEVQKYTGPQLSLPPVFLTSDQINALPDCPDATKSACQAPQLGTCPQAWTQGQCTCGSASGGSGCSGVCSCFPPPTIPVACNFVHTSRSVVVPAGGTTITVPLCVGDCDGGIPPTDSGTPAACPIPCGVDSDCGNSGLKCGTDDVCIPVGRLVDLQWTPTDATSNPFATYLDCNEAGLSPPGSGLVFLNPTFDVTCDPTSTSANTISLPPICGSGKCELHVSFACEPDVVTPGGITVTETLQLLNGCAPNTSLDCSGSRCVNEPFIRSFELPPPSSPQPMPAVQFASDAVCFTALQFPFNMPACQVNEAAVTVVATSEPHP